MFWKNASLTATGTIELGGSNDNSTISTALTDGLVANSLVSQANSFTKEGTGTVTLATVNTYSGTTTVSAGTLVLNSSIASSAVTVNSGATLQISDNATLSSLTVDAGGIVIVDAGKSLTITNDLANSGSSFTANHGASLIIGGTSTGDITYNVTVSDENWHLLSSPVVGEGYDTSWVNANLIDNTTDSGTNVGISTYINTTDADGDWTYVIDGASGTFATGQGYSIKRDATDSDISFTGTVKTDDASPTITANDIGGGSENRWTLIGNPYPSFINVTSLLGLTANATALEDSREALYVWNGTAYASVTTGYIHPGQGFFVNSNGASTTFAINEDMLSHRTSITFYKSTTSTVSVDLMISDGTNTKSTEINYLADKTTGLDPRFDIGTFTGTNNSFSIYSHLVSDSNGVDFMRQALPLDFENQIIPIGVNAEAGKEITFSAVALNLPTGIKVFLEDRTTNTFTRLDEANSEYKITLSEALNGIGRFYLHTKASVLALNDVTLENVSIYKTNNSTLRVVGLSQGKTNVKLFNILGKQVLNTSFKSNGVSEISLPKLATGVYIVQLENKAGKLNKKIVLE